MTEQSKQSSPKRRRRKRPKLPPEQLAEKLRAESTLEALGALDPDEPTEEEREAARLLHVDWRELRHARLVQATNAEVARRGHDGDPPVQVDESEVMVYCLAVRKVPRQGYQFAEFVVPAPTVVGLIDDDPKSLVAEPEILSMAMARWQDRFNRKLRNGGI